MAAILDAIQTIQWMVPFYLRQSSCPQAYIDGAFFGFEPDLEWEVLCLSRMTMIDPSTAAAAADIVIPTKYELSFQAGIKTLCVLDRSDPIRRSLIGKKKIAGEKIYTFYRRRRFVQRWYKETDAGKAKHVSALFIAISSNPEAFLNMVVKKAEKKSFFFGTK